MKHTCLILALLATLGRTAFANESHLPTNDTMESTGAHSMRLVDGTNVLALSGKATGFIASYLAMAPADSQELANRIIMLMKAGPFVDEQFLEFAEGNIATNRHLQKDNFELSLTNVNGEKYHFSYISNHNESLFVLNYRIMD